MRNLIGFVIAGLFFISCGSSGETTTEETGPDLTAPSIELSLAADDNMKYDKTTLTVGAGQQVILTLSHTGSMNKGVMGHNFVLLEKGVDVSEFSMAAGNFKANDFIPEDSEEIIAHTRLLGGGQSDKIVFMAPEPGTYDFICSFPGHFGMMQGSFVVK